MILQTIWNECVRFGGHVYIQVSYEEVPKKALNFAQSNLFSKGAILGQLWTQCGLGCLGVK
jgi:hypothetical protein